MAKFSDRLKELREEKGLSQRQLAKEIDIFQSNISRWESGSKDLAMENIIQLAEYFDVSVEYLLGQEKD